MQDVFVENVRHAIVVHTFRDDVSGRLHFIIGIAHSHADAGMSQHLYVVASVAESHRLADVEAIVTEHMVYAAGFVGSLADAVGKVRMPARGVAVLQDVGHNVFLLCFGKEGNDLHHLHVQRFLWPGKCRLCDVEQREDVRHCRWDAFRCCQYGAGVAGVHYCHA